MVWFFSKKEVLVVGKEEPDPDWEGINGIRYIQTSEFSRKYEPPLTFRTPAQNNVEPEPVRFEKIELKTEKKTEPIPIIPDTNEEFDLENIELKTEKKSMFTPIEVVSDMHEDDDFEVEEFNALKFDNLQNKKANNENTNIAFIDFESNTSNYDPSEEDNVEEYDEHIEDFSFAKDEKPIERSVRYSQSANLANVLY